MTPLPREDSLREPLLNPAAEKAFIGRKRRSQTTPFGRRLGDALAVQQDSSTGDSPCLRYPSLFPGDVAQADFAAWDRGRWGDGAPRSSFRTWPSPSSVSARSSPRVSTCFSTRVWAWTCR